MKLSPLPLLLLLAVAGQDAFAEGRSAGAAALIIGKLPVGTRAIALSGAYTALADDASAVWWNPACLARVNKPGMGLIHVEEGQDVRMEGVLFALPVIAGGTAAAGAGYLGMPPIVETMETPQGFYKGEGKTFDAWEFKGALGYGQYLNRWGQLPLLDPLWERGAVGVNVAVLGERVGGESYYSVSTDAGYLYDDPANGRRLGLVLRSLGMPADGAPLPVTGQAGVAQEWGAWNITGDILTATDDSYRVRGGLECNYDAGDSQVILRGGAQHSFSTHLNAWWSLGLGYRFKLPGEFEFSVDYAFVPVAMFNALNAVSVEVLF